MPEYNNEVLAALFELERAVKKAEPVLKQYGLTPTLLISERKDQEHVEG